MSKIKKVRVGIPVLKYCSSNSRSYCVVVHEKRTITLRSLPDHRHKCTGLVKFAYLIV